eukprot:jgi/Psemu1/326202/estExt_fgenesh1_pg.C_3480013
MSSQPRRPIGPEDVITVNGRYFYQGTSNTRFFVKGIAFPIPFPSHLAVDIDGWIAVLEQLASDTDINAIRVYEMDCYRVNDLYDPFLTRAAELGIYVIAPLTSSSGDGDLSRDTSPPGCYPKKLFHYGTTCIDAYWDRPNVIMGVIGNEVMNSDITYKSAPCVKSYLNDLAKYNRAKKASSLASSSLASLHRTSFPLMYATQHDSPTSSLHPDEAIKITLDYLACGTTTSHGGAVDLDFVFGINIESWCSSSQSFELEDDGVTESTYHSLWRTFSVQNKTVEHVDAVTGALTLEEVPPLSPAPVTVPVVFSEMGCSRRYFNRDNAAVPDDEKHIRDWKQISLVSSEDGPMADLWSGFVAYGYDGGGVEGFRMMSAKWNGKDPLPPRADELSKVVAGGNDYAGLPRVSRALADTEESVSSCEFAVDKIREYFGLELYSLSKMHSHYNDEGILSRLHVPQFHAPPSSAAPAVAVMPTGSNSEADITSANGEFPVLSLTLLLVFLVAGVFVVGKKRIGQAKKMVGDFVGNFGQSKDANKGNAEDKNISMQSTVANYGAI